MRKGIIVEHRLCPEYFEVGSAFQIHVDTNDYRNGILTHFSDEAVTFAISGRKTGDIEQLTISIDELRFRNSYQLVKMKPDYENGKFSAE